MNRKIVIPIFLLLFVGIVYLLAWSSAFTVSTLEIVGVSDTQSQQSIKSASGIYIGEKLARVEPRASSAQISRPHWIKKSSVSRNWLNGHVKITITPRIPLAIYDGKYIDSEGIIFELAGSPSSSLPIVQAKSPDNGLSAINLFTKLPQDFQSQVVQVSAKNQDSFTIKVRAGSKTLLLTWGSASDLALKIKVYRAIISLPENSKIISIDLSAPHAPIVK